MTSIHTVRKKLRNLSHSHVVYPLIHFRIQIYHFDEPLTIARITFADVRYKKVVSIK